MIERLLIFWCRYFHDDIYRPVGGQYRCAICLREYPVQLDITRDERAAAREVVRA